LIGSDNVILFMPSPNLDVQVYESIDPQTVYEHGIEGTACSVPSAWTDCQGQFVIADTAMGISNGFRVFLRQHRIVAFSPNSFTSPFMAWNEWQSKAYSSNVLDPFGSMRKLKPIIFVLEKRQTSALQLPANLVDSMDTEAFRWFAAQPHLVNDVVDLYGKVLHELKCHGLTYNCRVTVFSDPEEDDDDSIVIDCKIKGKSYKDIIEIWNAISLKLFSNLPSEVSDKIALTMEDE